MSTADPILRLFLQIAVILVVCRVFGLAGRRVGQTQAVCDMLAGIALGPSLFGALAPAVQGWLFPQYVNVASAAGATATFTHPSTSILYALSQLGLALYMFIVGLEFNIDLFRARVRSVLFISSAGVVVPFVLGAAAALLLRNQGDFFTPGVGASHAALFLGASMSITAFPMLARILDECGVSSTRLGTLTLAAGSMDDVVAWCLLAAMLASLNAAPVTAIFTVAGGAAFTVGMVWVARPGLRLLARWTERDGGVTPATLLTALVVAMASAAFTDFIGIHSVFGAFVAGTVMPRGRFAAGLREQMESLTTSLLLPLFFVYSGLNTRVGLVNTPALWMLTGLIFLIAIAGKGLACTLAARLVGEGWREASAIGTLMNARGLVELIMLNVGLQVGVIRPTLFTIMVLMAVGTTVMASPLFHYLYLRHPVARADAAAAVTAG